MTRSTDRQGRSLFRAHRSALEDLPPSAKLIARTLAEGSSMAQGQLAEETLLPDRTVRYGLNRLEEADVVEARPDMSDTRRQLYSLAPPED